MLGGSKAIQPGRERRENGPGENLGHSQVGQHGELGVGPVQKEVDEGAEPVAGAGGGCHGPRGWRGRG